MNQKQNLAITALTCQKVRTKIILNFYLVFVICAIQKPDEPP